MTYLHELEKICREDLPAASADAHKELIHSVKRDAFLESVSRFGTPHYLLDLEVLAARARFFSTTMRRHIPGGESFYAFKCNDLPLQVATLKEAGFGADVAGLFELMLALKLGFETILFSSPGKTDEELNLAIRKRKQVIINLDNMDELVRLLGLVGGRRLRTRLRVGLRINSEISAGSGVLWSKFGFSLDELKQAIGMIQSSPSLTWSGIHFHASWNKNPSKYVRNIQKISMFLQENFHPQELAKLDFFDIGGGYYPENQGILHQGEDKGLILDILGTRVEDKEDLFQTLHHTPHAYAITPVEPLEQFSRSIGEAIDKDVRPLNPHIRIFFEPGRFIAFPATSIILTVLACKGDCVIVDGGIHMLGDYKFSEYAYGLIINLSRPSTQLQKRTIYGPLCDPHDLWGYSHYGDHLQKGDHLAVLQQGAYTYSTAWRFIKPIPPYIAFDAAGRFHLAHRRESFRERYGGCLM